MNARRQRVVEPSEHPGHPPILVGWVEQHVELEPGANVVTRLYRGQCERCGKVVADVPRAADAESQLRAHRRACRPPLRVSRTSAPPLSHAAKDHSTGRVSVHQTAAMAMPKASMAIPQGCITRPMNR